jgi:hypothetical protein
MILQVNNSSEYIRPKWPGRVNIREYIHSILSMDVNIREYICSIRWADVDIDDYIFVGIFVEPLGWYAASLRTLIDLVAPLAGVRRDTRE